MDGLAVALAADLLAEKSVYMTKCKRIRATMEDDYKSASNQGISKKLLKGIIKERDFERKIAAIDAST